MVEQMGTLQKMKLFFLKKANGNSRAEKYDI